MNIKDAKEERNKLENRIKELDKIIDRGDPKTLMKKIKNYGDLCKHLEIKEVTESDFSFLPEKQRKKQVLFNKLQNINLVFGFTPDWINRNQSKWRPWFERQANKWVFDGSYCDYCLSVTVVGFYETEEISNYVGKTFLKEHTEFLEIQ